MKQGRAIFFEFLRIEATAKGIVYMTSPKGSPATPFPMVKLGDSRVVFENPEHDFPKRIIYRLTPDGSLNARVEGIEKGRATAEEWTWRRRQFQRRALDSAVPRRPQYDFGMSDDARADRAAHARVVKRLRDQADDVRRLVAGLDEESLSKRTIPEKWSLKELVCHVLRVQRVFSERLETTLGQENPPLTSYEPEGDPVFEKLAARPAEETLASYFAERERHIDRLEELLPAEWHRMARHPEFPHYDIHFQTDYLAHHEAHHIYQMLQRRAPFGRIPPEG